MSSTSHEASVSTSVPQLVTYRVLYGDEVVDDGKTGLERALSYARGMAYGKRGPSSVCIVPVTWQQVDTGEPMRLVDSEPWKAEKRCDRSADITPEIEAQSRADLDAVFDVIDAEWFDVDYLTGAPVQTGGEYRAKTDGELYMVGLNAYPEPAEIDCRGDVQAQAVEWLRMWSQRFADAAAAVEAGKAVTA